MSISRADVLATLGQIMRPDGESIVAAGMVRALTVDAGIIRFVLETGAGDADTLQALRNRAEGALRALDGVKDISIVMTAPSKRPPPPDLRTGGSAKPDGPEPVPGVNHIIAIASGKGGVGKSTLTANLAVALAAQGQRVGLLDADVYGPSQPRMLGISGRPASGPDGKTILPLRNHGVTLMSIGLMAGQDEAVVWRGPMLMGALQQMLFQVQWGALDVLLVDLPPGTGDVQMTLGQKTRLDGAIMVSTPQDVALLDVRKGIDMFQKMSVPILGMVENMSTHICTNCGAEEHIFGHGGVQAEAARIGAPLLAEIPLTLNIRTASDGGAPIVVASPNSAEARAFQRLAKRMIQEHLG